MTKHILVLTPHSRSIRAEWLRLSSLRRGSARETLTKPYVAVATIQLGAGTMVHERNIHVV